jgi:hypothetical protein
MAEPITVYISTGNYLNIRKYGSKVHTGSGGSSVALCGWWTKYHLMSLFTNDDTTCLKCIEQEKRYGIEKDDIVKLPTDGGRWNIASAYLEVK